MTTTPAMPSAAKSGADGLARIRRLSRILAANCTAMAVLLPPIVVGWWLLATPSVLNVRAGLPVELWHDLPTLGLLPWQRAILEPGR